MLPTINGRPCWWLADVPAEGVEHPDCIHRRYFLTCGQYDRLLARAGHRCEVCLLPAEENTRGRLYIDHDPDLGMWAVRGLLCRTCNNTIRFPWHAHAAATYDANAFYRTLLGERGVGLSIPVEPETAVLDHAGRVWRPVPLGWLPDNLGWPGITPQPWTALVARFGPHNLSADSSALPERN